MTDVLGLLRRLTLRQLRTFRVVARRRSISAAARELHLTQPAVSMQLKELEAACGMALYDRDGRGIRLTAAGEELDLCAAAVVDQIRTTEERLDALRGLRTGVLRLAAVSTAKYFAPAILAAFARSHPGVRVEFAVGNRSEVIRRLIDADSELAIMGRAPAEPETLGASFAEHPLFFIAPPTHPLARQRGIQLQALADVPMIIRERGSGTRATLEELLSGQRWISGMEAGSNETIKQAVMAGMGIAFISAHTVALEVQTTRLVVLDVLGTPVRRTWNILALASRRLSPLAEGFSDFVLEEGARCIDRALAAPVPP